MKEIKIYDEIWFAPAYHEKNIFDVYNIKNKTINCISVRPTKNNEKRYSNYIETNNEIWIMPAMVDYIIVIDKISKNIERDDIVNKELLYLNWTVIRFWGKEIKKHPEICIQVIEETIFENKLDRMELEEEL